MRTVYCPYCGNKMEIGDMVISFYCMNCGKAIDYGKVGEDKREETPNNYTINYNENKRSTKIDEARLLEAKLKHERFLQQKQVEEENRKRILKWGPVWILLMLSIPWLSINLPKFLNRIFNW